MTLSQADIVRMRMANQRISAPVAGTAQDVVQWLGAVQAQDFAGAKWGIGLRLLGVQEAQVEQAYITGAILRTHLMRPTWHFVTPADIRWLLALTAPRVRAAMGSINRQQGIDEALGRRANRCIENALRGGGPLTRDELRAVLEKDGIDPGGVIRMANIIMLAELEGLVCSGPRRGKQFTYCLLEERVPEAKTLDRVDSLAELAGRFFHSRGPATVQDFSRWSGLTVGEARLGLDAVKHTLVEERGESRSFWLPAEVQPAREQGPKAHLLSIYDEYISGYQDRSAMVDPAFFEPLRAMGNGLVNIVVVDGLVVGAWRRAEKKNEGKIELLLFRALDEAERAAVTAAGNRYGDFFGKAYEIR
jgi:hypothetical protein